MLLTCLMMANRLIRRQKWTRCVVVRQGDATIAWPFVLCGLDISLVRRDILLPSVITSPRLCRETERGVGDSRSLFRHRVVWCGLLHYPQGDDLLLPPSSAGADIRRFHTEGAMVAVSSRDYIQQQQQQNRLDRNPHEDACFDRECGTYFCQPSEAPHLRSSMLIVSPL